MWVLSLGQEDPLEKEMAAHASILTWETPWAEGPGGLQSVGSQELDMTEPQHIHIHLKSSTQEQTRCKRYLIQTENSHRYIKKKKKIVSTPLNPGNKNNGWKQKH